MEIMDDVAIVLTVFDGYVDLWDDCVELIQKYWNAHPPIYVFTNEIVKEWEGVTCIAVGKEAEWSRKVQKALEIVRQKYIILLLEDFFIGKKVDRSQLESLIYFMQKRNICYCKLCENNEIIHKKRPKAEKYYPYEVIYKNDEYGISLQAAVWERDFLKKCVGEENYNAWIFELNQLKKAQCADRSVFENAISDPRNILHIKHGALQGKMIPKTVEYFKRMGDPLSTEREVMQRKEYRKYYIKQLGKDITPKFAANFARKIAEKAGFSFVAKKWM